MAHDPLSITNETPPDFVNDEGVKWWRLDIGNLKDGAAYLVDKAGEQDYVIVKDDEIIRGTKNLEQLAYYLTQLELIRKHRVGYKPRKKRSKSDA